MRVRANGIRNVRQEVQHAPTASAPVHAGICRRIPPRQDDSDCQSAANAMHIWRIHQNGPCEPVKVASHRNSLVWNITSSISSSRMSMPKSDKILSAIHYWILEDVSVCSVSISCTGNMPSAFSKSWINSLPFCVHRVRITVLPFSNWEVSLPTYPFPL